MESCDTIKGMRRINTLKQIKNITDISLKNYILTQSKCLFCMIIYTVSALIFPGFISLIIDKGVNVRNIHNILVYSSIMLFTGIMMIIFKYLQTVLFFEFAQRVVIGIKEKIFRKLLKTNMKFWTNNRIGDIFTVIERDVSQLESLITTTISQVFVDFFVMIGISIYLIYINLEIGVSTIILSFVFAIAQRKVGNKVQAGMVKVREKIGDVTAFTSESLNNMNEIQVSGYSKAIFDKYNKKIKELVSESTRQIKVKSISQITGMGFNVLGICLVLYLGSFKVYQGTLSIGLLFSLTIYVQRLYSPVVSLGNAYVAIRNTIPIINKISKVIDSEDVIEDGSYNPIHNLSGNIEFNDIIFSYDKEKIINKLNIKIKQGDIVGIVGENGCGKTTLIRLLTKLCSPQTGEILLDDKDIKDYEIDYLRTQIGYMLQSTFLLSGKLRDVINPNQRNIHDDEIIKIMRKLNLELDEFSKGLDTEIGENKTCISGGQAQKIALARLFLEEKPILILDEPTASIDIKSELMICGEMKELLKEKTAIIITHRTEILNICSHVINLQETK